MANNFLNCEKTYNRQLASGFIAYMMAGSLFNKCFCPNKMEEQHLYLHYKEMPRNQQIFQEERILKILEQPYFEELQNLQCEVTFQKESRYYVVCFQTGGFADMKIRIDKKGRFQI